MTTPQDLSISQLRTDFTGRVIAPEDPEYDQMRAVFPGGIDRKPAVIIRPADTDDVVRAVALARDTGLPLAVRCGGHSGPGYGVCDGGIVIDLRDLTRLDIDVDGRTAWVEGGLTAGNYTRAVGEHGLATGFGDTGSVGIGGITLAGGIGLLVRKYGMTIDSLLAAEVVTADGQVLQVDTQSHPDLFWAIRGGGGNFGIVTRFKFKLHEVDGFVGGMMILPATPDNVTRFIELAQAAPDELSTIGNVMPAPPMPFVPAEYHGKMIIMALMAYAGDVEAGERAIAPFREIAKPIVDTVEPTAYSAMFQPEDDSYHPVAAGETLFIGTVDQADAETIFKYLQESDAPMKVAQLRVLGGAMARVAPDATAFAHRNSKIMVNVAAFITGPDDREARHSWVSAFASALRQNDSGAYVAFLGDDSLERVQQAYPGSTWDRLVQVKKRYDPTNLFRRNPNVLPG